MVDIVEALVGTAFLTPIVLSAIFVGNLPSDRVLALAAVLTLPLGWLGFTFERYIFSFRGRYEPWPILKFIREHVVVRENEDKTYTVDMSKILPLKKKSLANKLTLTIEDFEHLFDPYRNLSKKHWYWFKSHRSKHESIDRLPYVENIEDLFYFENQGLADFIRSAISNYHTYLAAAYSFILGCVFSIGLISFLNVNGFHNIWTILRGLDGTQWLGIAMCAMIVVILVYTTIRQSLLRKNEAIAHEYLLIRLMMTEEEQDKEE